jgi:CRP/FNR family cyclic AMP-dependent transcriptional regulator
VKISAIKIVFKLAWEKVILPGFMHLCERSKLMADRQELVDALQTIPWFQELSTEHFNKLLEIAITREYEAGQVIFHEGDKEDYLYIVLEGRVAIEMSVPGRGRMRILTAEPMDVVGWSSVTPVVRQRTAGARAHTHGAL